jgi:hypothetical protein
VQANLATLYGRNFTDHPAEIDFDVAQSLVSAPKLVNVGVALIRDQYPLADPPLGLTKTPPIDWPVAPATRGRGLSIGWASVENVTAFGCNVVSTTARSVGFAAKEALIRIYKEIGDTSPQNRLLSSRRLRSFSRGGAKSWVFPKGSLDWARNVVRNTCSVFLEVGSNRFVPLLSP